MGREVHFYVGARRIGSVHFSLLSANGQTRAYGIDYLDCLTYDEYGFEMVGSPDRCDGSGYYVPNWDRAVERVTKLKKCIRSTNNKHRKLYDTPRVDYLAILIQLCSDPKRRPYARVRLT